MTGTLVTAAAERLGVTVDKIFIDHHERAVFRSGDTVVKVEVRTPKRDAELVALRAAAAAGLPVPRILHVDDAPPPLVVLDYCAGTPLVDVDDERAWQAAGEALRALHDLPIPPALERFDFREPDWRRFILWWVDYECRIAPLRADVLDRLRTRMVDAFTAMPEPNRLFLHGDCSPAHFLIDEATNQVTAMIDFGDAGSGDPAYELAVLTLWRTDRLAAVLAGYRPDDERALTATLDAYRMLRHLGAATWLMEHGFDPTADLLALARFG